MEGDRARLRPNREQWEADRNVEGGGCNQIKLFRNARGVFRLVVPTRLLCRATQVLSHWRQQGHKALVFAQTQQMLDIIEGMVERQGYKYTPSVGTPPGTH